MIKKLIFYLAFYMVILEKNRSMVIFKKRFFFLNFLYFKDDSIIFSFLIINLLIYINLNKISTFININDKPDGKLKKHKNVIPLLGGTFFY